MDQAPRPDPLRGAAAEVQARLLARVVPDGGKRGVQRDDQLGGLEHERRDDQWTDRHDRRGVRRVVLAGLSISVIVTVTA